MHDPSDLARFGRTGAVLVVDDNSTTRMVMTRALALQGYVVVEAETGRQSLTLLREPREPPIDAVLLDLLMPDLDGYEVLEHIRADEKIGDVPVIVVSAIDDLDSAMRCIELGAADYLPKPVNPALLKARVGALTAERRLRDLDAELKILTATVAGLAADAFGPEALERIASAGGPFAELAHVVQELARAGREHAQPLSPESRAAGGS